jgi:predicted nucleotidyltransferase
MSLLFPATRLLPGACAVAPTDVACSRAATILYHRKQTAEAMWGGLAKPAADCQNRPAATTRKAPGANGCRLRLPLCGAGNHSGIAVILKLSEPEYVLGDRIMAVKDRRPAVRRVPSADDPTLGEVVGRLVRAYQPLKVYLFGSAARGDAGSDSDYDIVVIVPDNSSLDRQDEQLAYEALVGTGTAVDVLVYRASEFYERLPLRASLPAAVVREGKLLYAA